MRRARICELRRACCEQSLKSSLIGSSAWTIWLPRQCRDRTPCIRGCPGSLPLDFDAADGLLDWAAPYREMMGPFATVYGRCYRGMAARHRLDIPAALENFREAFEIGTGDGFQEAPS
jgi:hypothetical protein